MTDMDEILSALHEADKSGHAPTKLKVRSTSNEEPNSTHDEPRTSRRAHIPRAKASETYDGT